MIDKNNKTKILIIIIVTITTILAGIIVVNEIFNKDESQDIIKPTPSPENIILTNNYTIDIIREFNNGNTSNYLISPYNIEIGLNMLRDGADGMTKEELDKVLGNRVINNISVKDKIGVANGVFIKDIYKDNVKKDYYDILNTKYNSEIIYNPFTSPVKINNWVKEKTNGMIDKILDRMDNNFVMGLASALAIDVKWQNEFECNETISNEFTKLDNSKINVEMMHKTYNYNAKYIKNDEVEGIVIPYKKEDNSNVELEFVGILPNNSVNEYIKNLTIDKLNNIFKNERSAGEDFNIKLSLPRFKYDYEPSDFIGILNNLGIKEAFNPDLANFKKMVEIPNYNVYVGEAIHKTHIELNEKGTKAAAITYFGMYRSSAMMPIEIETVDVNFNKPFIYMIREKNTNEILFFGTVYEPNTWNGTTCDNK